MSLREILAQNMRQARRQLGLSQEELAERAGIDRTYVSSLERAVYSASLDTLARVAEALETEAHELLKPPTRRGKSG